MADRRFILVAARPRYAVWPGEAGICLHVDIVADGVAVSEGMWLYRDDGRIAELRRYRYGMLGRCA
jgi:hypothetical protein